MMARFFVALLLLSLLSVSQVCMAETQEQDLGSLHKKIDAIKAMPFKQTKSSLAIEAKAFEQAVLDIKDTLSKIKRPEQLG